ncbi:MAG TPA: beta-ketoacyl-[acyl-carrier-protein] synthase family protein [Polyangiaceae bacterium LLY-WYZ-15_(1-7)]|nr:3-oxoacyl-ACP synthase [Sandaracinus sp.]HJL00298.1 beta-ketoacyl-[acyl-carrier-protein] synthase family protein [Polyangiaceae bacterium LLY-WYZ-15_(1-7)]MBJ73185.1 3-oxoacyl-ACP synthase [Sandaracinus sp.]HJL06850.1 beta-ketoacyl-[acyl-carrier-protein] synthase family protein [Polyangiaceae bacterium LLY-WYZ-15_(1-7)]HJL36217.1 beta-ketoacyl-[acyl-carrier-protein] synthase family protein [Polyangiaceae bacterium LLY-WYZ-15_(1-7)]
MRRVFVTGVGVISSLGFGREAFWRSLVSGRSGAAPIELFDTSDLDRSIACEVKGFRPRDFLTAAEVRRTGRCSAMSIAAARMAVEDAGIGVEHLEGPGTSVILGTTMGEANVLGELEQAWLHQGEDSVATGLIPRYGTTLLPIHVARAFGARGMVQTMPAACAAGNYAIGYAADQVRAGRADVALTGAAEVIERLQFAGFCRLGAVSPDVCRPFDQQRQGLLVGEGAAILVLESEESVVRRGATPLAEVGGYGLACDAHHITRPHPDGEGSAHAMREAIRTSGLDPRQVDFVNAHGTGTAANDKVESKVLAQIFGDRQPMVTSVKSMLGHCMGAASAMEAVSCVLTLQDDVVPPTMNYEHPDPECEVNLVANAARKQRVDVVLNNSLAFGGYDAVVAFAKPDVLPNEARA